MGSLDVAMFLDKHTYKHPFPQFVLLLLTVLALESDSVALCGKLELLIKELCTVMTRIDFQFPRE